MQWGGGQITEDFECQYKEVRIYVEAVKATEGFVMNGMMKLVF